MSYVFEICGDCLSGSSEIWVNILHYLSLQEDSPDREVYRDPNVVRSEDNVEDETIVKRSQTASRMLSLFRQMEEQKDSVPDGEICFALFIDSKITVRIDKSDNWLL